MSLFSGMSADKSADASADALAIIIFLVNLEREQYSPWQLLHGQMSK